MSPAEKPQCRSIVPIVFWLTSLALSSSFDKRPSAGTGQSAADANLCEDLLFAPSLVHVSTADLLTQNVRVGTLRRGATSKHAHRLNAYAFTKYKLHGTYTTSLRKSKSKQNLSATLTT